MKQHEPFWIDLIRPFRERFGYDVDSGYMNMRKIIHHLYKVIGSNTAKLDIEYLERTTGYTKNKVVEIIEWLQQEQVIDFEINWSCE